MATKNLLTKKALIEKASHSIVVITALAAFISVFCLVASKSLLSQAVYQNRVIGAKKTALTQLKKDASNFSILNSQFKAFITTPTNIIGGNPVGNQPNSGDSAKIVEDALPAELDFPAIVTSVNYILSLKPVTISSISGTDGGSTAQSGTSTSGPVPIPITVSFSGAYSDVQNIINSFQTSIRPFQVSDLHITANQQSVEADITMQTYYQPGVSFQLGTETVK